MMGEAKNYLGRNLSAEELVLESRRKKAAAEVPSTVSIPSPFTEVEDSRINALVERAHERGMKVGAVIREDEERQEKEWVDAELKRLTALREEEDAAVAADALRRQDLLDQIESAPVTQRSPRQISPIETGAAESPGSPISGVQVIDERIPEMRVKGTLPMAPSTETTDTHHAA